MECTDRGWALLIREPSAERTLRVCVGLDGSGHGREIVRYGPGQQFINTIARVLRDVGEKVLHMGLRFGPA